MASLPLAFASSSSRGLRLKPQPSSAGRQRGCRAPAWRRPRVGSASPPALRARWKSTVKLSLPTPLPWPERAVRSQGGAGGRGLAAGRRGQEGSCGEGPCAQPAPGFCAASTDVRLGFEHQHQHEGHPSRLRFSPQMPPGFPRPAFPSARCANAALPCRKKKKAKREENPKFIICYFDFISFLLMFVSEGGVGHASYPHVGALWVKRAEMPAAFHEEYFFFRIRS